MSAILFLGISAYCIRNYNKCRPCRGIDQRNRRIGSNLRMSHFEEILDEDHDSVDELHELGVTHKNLVLNQETNPVISPYRMNPAYRRPGTTDSDHGYSTMTPMGDIDSGNLIDTDIYVVWVPYSAFLSISLKAG